MEEGGAVLLQLPAEEEEVRAPAWRGPLPALRGHARGRVRARRPDEALPGSVGRADVRDRPADQGDAAVRLPLHGHSEGQGRGRAPKGLPHSHPLLLRRRCRCALFFLLFVIIIFFIFLF